ncbi:synaptotagmin-5 isoform X2 [Hypomesus transpacificus]|uniref:synaptotagmin-5 isoform X2 n=1 Tax=Hypomesus transpacificus TaxID=137520 RepID=UPI001F075F4C|nr:synaptotagmin-5 isoform X2 [Hypomesus transpacificus]
MEAPHRAMTFVIHDPVSWKAMLLPMSEQLKWCILGLSVVLFILAMGLLLWQTIRFCTYTHTPQEPDSYLPLDTPPQGPQTQHSFIPNYKMEAPRWTLSPSASSAPPAEPGCSWENVEREAQGSLTFSLYHDHVQSQLVVTVLQASGLQPRAPNQRLHPFVGVRLLWAGPVEEGRSLQRVQGEWQSRVVKDSLSPSFGDQFIHTLEPEKELARHTVRLEVKDYDSFSREESLGEVRVPLGQLHMTSYPLELLKDLHTPQKDLVGEVLLSLRFLPTCQRLEVGLLKIRTLPPHTHTQKALHARVSVQCNQVQLHHQKSSYQRYTEVTIFNQVLPFSLPETDIHQCSIMLSVYHSLAGRKSTRRLIGQTSLGKGGAFEDQHWSLMMRSVRQPIAQWHQLLI